MKNTQKIGPTASHKAFALSAAILGSLTFGSVVQGAPNFTQVGFSTVGSGTRGGAGGATINVTTPAQLISAASRSGATIVIVENPIHLGGDIRVSSNKSIIGHGTRGNITGGGLIVSGSSNVIIQNLSISGSAVNDITVEQGANHVWIDHCILAACHDTLLDIKRGADFITVSWNEFRGPQDEVVLQGHSDSNGSQDIGHLRTTYHHNWFHDTTQRHPRVRFAQTHVFNNFEAHLGVYGVASTNNASVLVEANYFLNVPTPTTDTAGTSPLGNIVVTADNIRVNSGAFIQRGHAFNPRTYYNYTLDAASSLPTEIPAFSGVGKTGE